MENLFSQSKNIYKHSSLILSDTEKLHYVQNSVARILMRVRKKWTFYTNSVFIALASCLLQDWLQSLATHIQIHQRTCASPSYRNWSHHKPPSALSDLLSRSKLHTMGDWAFCCTATHLLNSHTNHLRAAQTLVSFKELSIQGGIFSLAINFVIMSEKCDTYFMYVCMYVFKKWEYNWYSITDTDMTVKKYHDNTMQS